MSVEAIIDQTASVLTAAFPALAKVWTNAPEAIQQLPAVVIAPQKGTLVWPRKPNLRDVTHDLDLTLVVNRGGDLASADHQLKPWLADLIAVFDAHITLNGSCLSAGIVDYRYGRLEYAGVDYLGLVCTLRAREVEQVVYQG